MTVTEESGGRLNVFAKEPEIQVIEPKSSTERLFRLLILAGAIILISIFGWYLTYK
tara:strand:+ start:129 stop:296 length:168 start_codon:yes stop_codon:yes gene_type:complete